MILRQSVRGVDRVAACSAEARRRGVVLGMSIAECAALEEINAASTESKQRRDCPNFCVNKNGTVPLETRWVIVPHDPVADREALEQFVPLISRYSPLVGVEQADAPQCLLLEIEGVRHLFGGERRLAEQLADDFQELGFRLRWAVADTLAAAWAVAHFGENLEVQPRDCPNFRVSDAQRRTKMGLSLSGDQPRSAESGA
ncbi:MAG: hypothetical protein ACOY3P_10660, partial [Planctomycetota bacterium]